MVGSGLPARHGQLLDQPDTLPGPSAFLDDDDVRFFPAIGELQLNIVNYGFAGSYKMWRSCSDVSGARVCEDKLALGGGLSIYQFDVDSLSTRYRFPGRLFQILAPGAFYGPPQYVTETNHQTLAGDETESRPKPRHDRHTHPAAAAGAVAPPRPVV